MNASDRTLCPCGPGCGCAPCRCGGAETLAQRGDACGCGPACTCRPSCHCDH